MQTEESLNGIKVLVTDDSSTIRRSAQLFLKQVGCEVILAEDGFEALGKIPECLPSVIFLDIMMPRLDGYQTCSVIKRNRLFHATPVIMLSGQDGGFDRARGKLVGADEDLSQAFTKESLLGALGRHYRQITTAIPEGEVA